MSYPLFHPESGRPPVSTLAERELALEFPQEDRFVEFKEGFGQRRLQEAVVAFSNSDGGVILIGVRDDGLVKGVVPSGNREATLHQLVANLHNPGRYKVRHLTVEKRNIVVLTIQCRHEGFSQTPDGRVLVRRGASNTALMGRELSEFMARRTLVHFERTATAMPLRAADQDLLRELATAWGWSGDAVAERLREASLVTREDGEERLTVAGALYLTEQPHRVLGKTFVEIFRYRDDGPSYDRRIEVQGPLPTQVRETTRLVQAELGFDLVVVGLIRQQLPRLPEEVLREAIANAVAHRSYETAGASVRVEIRPDRVDIISPGGLPEPVTLENIREQCSARNNDVIRTLRRFKLAEDAGTGVDRMEDAMAANLLRPPLFKEPGGTAVSVTLWLETAVTKEERAWIDELELGGSLRASDRLLVVMAARGEALSNARAREILGVDHLAARKALQRLRDHGLLVQSGQRGGATYRISQVLPGTRTQLDQDEIEKLVLEAAREAPLTNTSVRRLTGLDRSGALTLLARLVARGDLRRRGERRGAHYVRTLRTKPLPRGESERLLAPLVDQTWQAFDRAGKLPSRVTPAAPILFFGDLDAYLGSPLRVLTVGLNPSLHEFPSDNAFARFPLIRNQGEREPSRYLAAMSAYFRTYPYRRWFSAYEYLLNGASTSYYDARKASTALHTDICSPVATNPTWSELRRDRADLEAVGVPLWHELLVALRPQIVFLSVAKVHLDRIRFPPIDEWRSLRVFKRTSRGDLRRRPYRVRARWYDVDGEESLFVFGQAAFTPFQLLSRDQKHEVGASATETYEDGC